MLTIKHYYKGENYHVFAVTDYFIDRSGTAKDTDMVGEDAQYTVDVPVGKTKEGVIYPKISMTLADGSSRVLTVVSATYVENSAGKTIDTIRPHMKRGQAKHG